jgi:hypothetical protein
MTLRATRTGYVSLSHDQNQEILMTGMYLPEYCVGDSTCSGRAIAEIPDLESWEIKTQIAEIDRGHIEVGQDVEITVIAVPDGRFHGKIKLIGGTSGTP